MGRRPNWVSELGDDWKRVLKGKPPYAQIGAELKTLHGEHGLAALRAAWNRFLGQPEARFGVPYFARNLGLYLDPQNGARAPRSVAADVAESSAEIATAYLQRTGGKVT